MTGPGRRNGSSAPVGAPVGALVPTVLRIAVTPGRSGLDVARLALGHRGYETRSRSGAVFALARLLVAAGFPDRPWAAINVAAPAMVALRGPSLHEAARWTIADGEDGLKLRRWKALPSGEGSARMRAAQAAAGEGAAVPTPASTRTLGGAS